MNNLPDIVNALTQRGLCDHCLGRQLGKLYSGTTNDKRGQSLRLYSQMAEAFNETIASEEQGGVRDETEKMGDTENGAEGEKAKEQCAGEEEPDAGGKEHDVSREAHDADGEERERCSKESGKEQDVSDKKLDDKREKQDEEHEEHNVDLDKSCSLCGNLFKEVDTFADLIAEAFSHYSFDTYLVGSVIDADIIDSEKELQTELGIGDYGESIKSEMNRVVGLRVYDRIGKEVSFEKPDIVGVVDTRFDSVSLQVAPVFLYGRYQKFDRTIPQTIWNCKRCRGRGCEYCKGTGKIYPTSVQELIGDVILNEMGGTRHLFHGMGREDIDARMLGTGRPFILEISNPVSRGPHLEVLTSLVNESAPDRVKISPLSLAKREHVSLIKNMKSDKSYLANVELDRDVTADELRRVEEAFTGTIIAQRTPSRVAHRRSDLVRERKVLNMHCRLLDGRHSAFTIRGESGLYIKELIHGNEGRTQPSVSEFLDTGCRVTALDVLAVHYTDNLELR